MRLTLLAIAIVLAAALPATASGQAITGPSADTSPATDITTDSATLHAAIDSNGQPTTYRFEYGTTSTYGSQTAEQPTSGGFGPEDATAAVTGLAEGTVYHFHVVAWPDSDPTAVVDGGDRSFRTLALPGAATTAARETSSSGTTMTGKVDPNRLPTTWYFEWGTTKSYGQQTPVTDAGKGSSAFQVRYALTGLAPNTSYHFRLVAQNAAGVRRGDDRVARTRRGPTGITVGAPVRNVRYGRGVTINGVVQGTGIDGLRVALELTPFPFLAPFAAIGDAVPIRRDGSFSLVSPPLQISTRLRVVTRTTPSVQSSAVTALARLVVGAGTRRIGRRRYAIEGGVAPHVRGAKVTVQRLRGKRWVAVRRTRAAEVGHGRIGYSAVVPQVRHVQQYRVLVRPPSAAYALGTSRTITVPGVRHH
jgi:hypothetical protein